MRLVVQRQHICWPAKSEEAPFHRRKIANLCQTPPVRALSEGSWYDAKTFCKSLLLLFPLDSELLYFAETPAKAVRSTLHKYTRVQEGLRRSFLNTVVDYVVLLGCRLCGIHQR